MNRQEIRDSIAKIQEDERCSEEMAMVIFMTERDQATVEYVMGEVTRAIKNDERTNFIYTVVIAVWQGLNETVKVIGNYLKQREEERKANKKRG